LNERIERSESLEMRQKKNFLFKASLFFIRILAKGTLWILTFVPTRNDEIEDGGERGRNRSSFPRCF